MYSRGIPFQSRACALLAFKGPSSRDWRCFLFTPLVPFFFILPSHSITHKANEPLPADKRCYRQRPVSHILQLLFFLFEKKEEERKKDRQFAQSQDFCFDARRIKQQRNREGLIKPKARRKRDEVQSARCILSYTPFGVQIRS